MGCRAIPAELRVFAAALLDRCARLERLLKLVKDAQFGRSGRHHSVTAGDIISL
jgi:hypothetical protein